MNKACVLMLLLILSSCNMPVEEPAVQQAFSGGCSCSLELSEDTGDFVKGTVFYFRESQVICSRSSIDLDTKRELFSCKGDGTWKKLTDATSGCMENDEIWYPVEKTESRDCCCRSPFNHNCYTAPSGNDCLSGYSRMKCSQVSDLAVYRTEQSCQGQGTAPSSPSGPASPGEGTAQADETGSEGDADRPGGEGSFVEQESDYNIGIYEKVLDGSIDHSRMTYAMVYGSYQPYDGTVEGERHWGSLSYVDSPQEAIEFAKDYARQVDSWNGDKGVVPVIDVVAYYEGRFINKDWISELIREANDEGVVVSLDLRISDKEYVDGRLTKDFGRLIDTYLSDEAMSDEDFQVWFSFDFEQVVAPGFGSRFAEGGGKVSADRLNDYQEMYFGRLKQKGLHGNVISYDVFEYTFYNSPDKIISKWDNGYMIPVFCGYANEGDNILDRVVSQFNMVIKDRGYKVAEGMPYGCMEYHTFSEKTGTAYTAGFTQKEYYDRTGCHIFAAQ